MSSIRTRSYHENPNMIILRIPLRTGNSPLYIMSLLVSPYILIVISLKILHIHIIPMNISTWYLQFHNSFFITHELLGYILIQTTTYTVPVTNCPESMSNSLEEETLRIFWTLHASLGKLGKTPFHSYNNEAVSLF